MYPRILTKTSPHGKILKEFRKKYIEQEAIDTALPEDVSDDENDDWVRRLTLVVVVRVVVHHFHGKAAGVQGKRAPNQKENQNMPFA